MSRLPSVADASAPQFSPTDPPPGLAHAHQLPRPHLQRRSLVCLSLHHRGEYSTILSILYPFSRDPIAAHESSAALKQSHYSHFA